MCVCCVCARTAIKSNQLRQRENSSNENNDLKFEKRYEIERPNLYMTFSQKEWTKGRETESNNGKPKRKQKS